MINTRILEKEDPHLNAALIAILLSPFFFRDFKLQEDGLHCFFIQSISHFHVLIKTFLAALYEITNKQFYFEIIDDQEAILRIYGVDGLQFSQDILFKSSISSQGRRK
ncbi:MAG: hypothetical protein ACFFAE_09690 [Candidatus Hodarchaeota archaeon]